MRGSCGGCFMRYRVFSIVPALLVAFGCIQCANAQSSRSDFSKAVPLDPIVVTATRSPQRLSTVLADVTVIGADEIARAGQSGLAELLARQPGIEISTNGGPASTSAVFLRGANNAQTLVLIDGVR